MPERKIGWILATFILISCVIGSSITDFTRELAVVGSISSLSIVVMAVFAIGLVYIYSELGRLDPQVGGLVGHITKFSPKYGRHVCTLYFHGTWLSNLIIAISAVAFLKPFFPILYNPVYASLFIIVQTWLICAIFSLGLRRVIWLIVIGVIIQMLPIFFLLIFGWSKFDSNILVQNWNVTGTSDHNALLSGAYICVWYFIGFESSSVNAGNMVDPQRNIARSTIYGLLLILVLYVLANILSNGIFSTRELIHAESPHLMALSLFLPAGFIVGYKFLLFFACMTSLMSWMLILSQVALRGGRDGFLPKYCQKLNKNQVPLNAMIYMSIFTTAVMILLMFCPQDFLPEVLDYIAKITVLLISISYIYLSLYFLIIAKKFIPLLMCALSLLFCVIGVLSSSFDALSVAAVIFMIAIIRPKTQKL